MPVIRFRWRSLLKAARSEQDVLVLVRSYLESWTPQEIAFLPPGVWPVQISSRQDVIGSTFQIGKAHGEFRGNAPQLDLLQDLLLFMTQASVRVTQLVRHAGQDLQIATEPEEGIGGAVPIDSGEIKQSKT